MFVLSSLVYPAVVALLCAGAGLAVDRAAGQVLPGPLVAPLGLAALIAVAELTTYAPGLAPSTPYVLAGLGAAGLALGWRRVRYALRRWRNCRWQFALPLVAFAVACAPMLSAGRPTFSAYMVLTDSALHIMGADYLIRHGQHYAHLDLLNSYGLYINNYYNQSYPTGADALLGGTSFLLGVPVIWAFQPFNALVLALAAGPAWVLAHRIGLRGGWAATATLAATVPALVYAYELIGSVKEITALPLVLTLGALAAGHLRWLRGSPRAAIPFALVVAGGVSALGVAFGIWAAITVVVLVGVLLAERGFNRYTAGRLLALSMVGAVALVICAWPTWHHASGSVAVAQAIATSANRGNLVSPLQIDQALGTWLAGNYEFAPFGGALVITDGVIAVTALFVLIGAAHVIASRRYALGGWLLLVVAACLVLTPLDGAWADAKILVLSSPAFILLAFAAVAALRRVGHRALAIAVAAIVAGGVLASDLVQYHDTDLAPTARYDELASIDARFAGRGPTLFTDFDEYALYELRDMDVGGPDFLFPPVGLVGIDSSHGGRIELSAGRAAALRAYPLIVTRVDPAAVRPPSAYRLLWQGTYYQVWGRRPGAPAAVARFASPGLAVARCQRVRAVARVAAAHDGTVVAASPAELVRIDLGTARTPSAWQRQGAGYAMTSPGQLEAGFRVPRAGVWRIWLQGEIMRTVDVAVDGRPAGSIGDQVAGDLSVPDTMTPLSIRLTAGRHRLTVTSTGFDLAAGNGGDALLSAVFLTPTGARAQEQLHAVAAARWRTLCGHRYVWVEAIPAVSPAAGSPLAVEAAKRRHAAAQARRRRRES